MKDEMQNPGSTNGENTPHDEAGFSDSEILMAFAANRRQFLKQVTALSGGIVASQLPGGSYLFSQPSNVIAADALAPGSLENPLKAFFTVNGTDVSVEVDSRMALLDALREKLNLTGSKKGCDHGQCGACTVIIDGRRVLSCLTLTATCQGKNVLTVEGIAKDNELHPLQDAFIKHDGFQCGYCTPGQICSAVALLEEAKNGEASFVSENISLPPGPLQLSDDEIRERMSGNICRCGAYPNIVAAIKEVHTGKEVEQTWQHLNQ